VVLWQWRPLQEARAQCLALHLPLETAPQVGHAGSLPGCLQTDNLTSYLATSNSTMEMVPVKAMWACICCSCQQLLVARITLPAPHHISISRPIVIESHEWSCTHPSLHVFTVHAAYEILLGVASVPDARCLSVQVVQALTSGGLPPGTHSSTQRPCYLRARPRQSEWRSCGPC
jgi:hypothetical protein